jgi:arylsulfatase A
VLTDYLNEWIAHHRAGPFFIFYSELLPHNPTVVPPGSDADTQQEKVIDMWEYGDKMVGKILAQLNQLGLREETLMLFTSDNGSSARVNNVRVMTEHGPQRVTGEKGKTTPAGTWVPFIVSWPGHIKAGQVSDAVIDSLTIFPTLADVGEADRATDLDGESILPILLGQQATTQGWSYTWYDPLRPQGDGFNDFAGEYIQDGRWKLYRWHNCSQHDWLFDLHTDWKEQRPIASGGTAEQREARARLASLMRKVKPKNTQPVSCSRGTKE